MCLDVNTCISCAVTAQVHALMFMPIDVQGGAAIRCEHIYSVYRTPIGHSHE